MMYFHTFPPCEISIVLQHVYRLWVRRDGICPVLITQTGDLAGEITWLPFHIAAGGSSAVPGDRGRAHRACLDLRSDMGLGCLLSPSHSSSERINADPKGLATVFPAVNTFQRVCLTAEMKKIYDLCYLVIKNEGRYSSHVTVPASVSVRTDPGMQRRLESCLSSSLLRWGFFFFCKWLICSSKI